MATFNLTVNLPGIKNITTNSGSFVPSDLRVTVLDGGTATVKDLPSGITSTEDLNLGFFPLWRHLKPYYTNYHNYLTGDGIMGVRLTQNGAGATLQSVAFTEETVPPVQYNGKSALLYGNIQRLNTNGIERKQLGSLIKVIPVKASLAVDDPYTWIRSVVLARPTELSNARITVSDLRDSVFELTHPAITALSIFDVAIFSMSVSAYLRARTDLMFNNNVYSSATTTAMLFAGFTNDRGFNMLALKTTGPNAKNTFTDDVPYPRVINVQTLNPNIEGVYLRGFNLYVNPDLGIDLTDDNKYMFMTSVVDASELDSIYVGDEFPVETTRTSDHVYFAGRYSSAVQGTKYMWVAIVQMYA